MRASPEITVYEVLCHRCNVTFPVGSKHCIHCGGRLGRPSSLPGLTLSGAPAHPGELFGGAEEAEAEETQRRSPFSPVALMWIVLFAGGTIYRACTGS